MHKFCNYLVLGLCALSSSFARSQAAPGTLQPEFASALALDGSVIAIAEQSDGKLLLAGTFKTASGLGRTNLVRLNSDGQVDAGFAPPANLVDPANPLDFHLISSIAVTPDGGVLVGGYSTAQVILATNAVGVKKLLPNGAIDSSFSASAAANHYVQALIVRPDGSFFSGDSNYWEVPLGTPDTPPLLLLDANGNPVANAPLPQLRRTGSFNTPPPLFSVGAFAFDTDGSLLAGGAFEARPSGAHTLIRLRPDGSQDTNFETVAIAYLKDDVVLGSYMTSEVRAIALQRDRKIIVGGTFTDFGVKEPRAPRLRLARLHADGTVDESFDPGLGVGNPQLWLPIFPTIDKVNALAVQWDGKILVGGLFGNYHTNTVRNLARVNQDGSLDTTFQIGAGPNGPVRAIHILPDGDLLIAGDFTEFNGVPQRGIARVSSGMGPLLSALPGADGQNRLQVHGETGKTYTLQFKNTLDAAAWEDAGEAAGNGAALVFTNAMSGRAQVFYRVKVD